MPHQHSHHHHYHHIHSSTNQSSPDGNDKGTGTSDFRATMDSDEKQKKYLMKRDEAQARSFNDVRKSAPDVIIIAGCNSSH